MDKVIFCPICAWVGIQYDDTKKNIGGCKIDKCPCCHKNELIDTSIPATECEMSPYKHEFYEFRRKLFTETIEPLGKLDKKDAHVQVRYHDYFEGGEADNIKTHQQNMNEIKNGNFSKYIKTNIPKCPVCGSTDLQKISTANKVGSAALFGVFSLGHISKTFKCLKCGYKF